jgi:hypothetical protein
MLGRSTSAPSARQKRATSGRPNSAARGNLISAEKRVDGGIRTYDRTAQITTRNDALANAYIWLQYGHFGCNWNQLHLSFLVDRWLQLERCNSLRQPFYVALQQIFLLQQTRK